MPLTHANTKIRDRAVPKNVKIPGVLGKSIIEFPGMVSDKILYNPMSVEKAMYKLSFKAFSKNSI